VTSAAIDLASDAISPWLYVQPHPPLDLLRPE